MTYLLVGEQAYEDEIKKSRFIAIARQVEHIKEAMQFIDLRSDQQAHHNCWAYKIGGQSRFSDDGEPGGTAGRPILQAIEGQDCDFVVVLVIRWFGGIKLGTGGLIRAYGGVAAECLRLAQKKLYIHKVSIRCFCTYAQMDLIKARLVQFQAQVESQNYDANGVQWTLQLPPDQIDRFTDFLINMTRGQGWVNTENT